MTWWERTVLLLGLLGSVGGAAAEQIVSVPDTTLRQGQKAALPVWVHFQLPEDGSSLALTLLYSAQRLRLLRAWIEAATGCSQAEFRDTLLGGDTGRVQLLCTSFPRARYEGIFAWLEFEVLAGRDTLAWLTPVEIQADGSPLPLQAQTTRLRIEDGPPVEPIRIDELSVGFPNPFVGELRLRYVVAQAGWVRFDLFSWSGKRIALEPAAIYAPGAGTYVALFRFRSWEVASGGYIVRMQTERGGVSFGRILCVK